MYASPPDWWSVGPYCLGQLFLEHGHVSDTCSTTMTATAHLCQLLSIPTNCNRTGMVYQLLSYVECALHVSSFQKIVGLFGPVYDLVGKLAAWSGVLFGEPNACQ